jgi:hypothetical protein
MSHFSNVYEHSAVPRQTVLMHYHLVLMGRCGGPFYLNANALLIEHGGAWNSGVISPPSLTSAVDGGE